MVRTEEDGGERASLGLGPSVLTGGKRRRGAQVVGWTMGGDSTNGGQTIEAGGRLGEPWPYDRGDVLTYELLFNSKENIFNMHAYVQVSVKTNQDTKVMAKSRVVLLFISFFRAKYFKCH